MALPPRLVTSASPSLAAAVPYSEEKGAACAFTGRVPVRCRGPVRCGDLLVPSGLNDGVAIGRRSLLTEKARWAPRWRARRRLGRDMEHATFCNV